MQLAYVKEEVQIPQNVAVHLEGKVLRVKGSKGEITRDFSFAKGIEIRLDGNKVIFEATFLDKRKKALFYSVISHVKNMFRGASEGYVYKLKVLQTHFPMSVKVVKDVVQITNLIGEKNVRKASILEGVKVTVKGDEIVVEGSDLERVAQTAANIEQASKIRGFDKRIFGDGIYITSKGE
ncbi:50S ribosomal protein L6 [Sulfodiicoccus acidiphilus]|uniref:Large ribosomal subunit protein uL6 n=1 Tax=Sulfodiicoccus acidiphilus TaxID=1670455 RepID=A0A348B158_9CREN|nr:50S ribosomal protein L6 [Sulfodiicoccus acidiphilus]BBD71910.1 50S ribosomal protein L6 [Sulfodiicoccus acidiphilus]GGT91384.1 50S ribosomal protein L6 [Sulfodiicoccus acidiphilus]